MFTLDDAIALATRAHAGQVDKIGVPYINHVRYVMDAVAEHGKLAQMVGVLHDIVEDTWVTLAYLRELGVPEEVVEGIDSVTKRPRETYMEAVARAKRNAYGRLVKLADNAHNSDESRLARVPARDAERLRKKYRRARALLLAD